METQLYNLNQAHDLFSELCEAGDGDSETAREMVSAQTRHQNLLGDIGHLKDALNAELSE